MSKILVDINTYSHLINGNKRVVEIIESADVVYFSVIVIGELLTWFKFGKKIQHNKDQLSLFTSSSSIQVIDTCQETAEIYSDLYVKLQKKGKPIPINDIWIAAQAIEYGTKLITFDRDFSYVPGLRFQLLKQDL